jgi:DinB superfamily
MSRGDLLATLAAYPVAVAQAASAAIERPIPTGEWGPADVVRHLIAVEVQVHQARFADLERESSPTWDWAEPGPWPGEPELTLDQLLERFAHLREETIATIEGWDEAAWERAGTHTTYGRLDVAGLLRNMTTHDEEHLRGLG